MVKKILGIILIAFVCSSVSYGRKPSSIILSTYNLRCLTDADNARGDQWTKRLPIVKGLIEFHGFDIFGTQELRYSQIEDLLKEMPQYKYVGAGRDDGKKAGEHVAIFYDPAKFELIDSGNFWLNEDETHPVKGWDAAYIRICTWGKFKVKENGFTFLYYNVHLDNEGDLARKESAKMIISKMNAMSASMPAIMAGDFNVTENSSVYRAATEGGKLLDARKVADIVYCNNSTYNDFNPAGSGEGVIDFILLTKDFKVKKYGLLTDVYRSVDANGIAKARTPSDHFPIMLQLEVK